MTSVYRYRPFNDYSIDELKNNYLWFSKPTEFNDVDDSNISSFVKSNESIRNSFDRIFKSPDKLIEECKRIGICCFTKKMPRKSRWNCFPKGSNGFFIEYDKDILEQNFRQRDCFKDVEYYNTPLKFLSYSDGYDIEWERQKDGILYRSLRGIEIDPRLYDELFLKMFTRINVKYKKQNEVRIILAGVNTPILDTTALGSKQYIPDDAIIKIYINNNSKDRRIKQIKEICYSKNIKIKQL